MTSIPTTADLLRLLREDPDFRDEVRRLVLSQELLELPDRLARFEANVDRQFKSVDERFNSVDERFNSIDGRLSSIDGELGRLKGGDYERKVIRAFTSYASNAFRQRHNRRLRHNRLLLGDSASPLPEYEEMLAGAVESGIISDDELEDLQQADAVMIGQDQGNAVYVVGEFSVTVNERDIDRAVARAGILRRATGCQAWPMVIGDTIPEPQRARAEAEGVAFRLVGE